MIRYGLFLAIFILSAMPVWAQPYEVVSILAGSAEIKDVATNTIVKIKVGEPLGDGWKVVTIENEAVVIEKWLSEDECIRNILPNMIVRERKQ
ncbi:MAG: hypothetical protein A2091_06785 [Desulfuromonadales bacterium GWD2_61_12]|nr:MAG: hypothetical protein A2005_09635 [Desulfuromonadales bacterium GWC2_61_20]OGR36663.1 MAG: hypothetical protein A2091_06785 [Desulfuromonadales bacterium GWD2_61_12]